MRIVAIFVFLSGMLFAHHFAYHYEECNHNNYDCSSYHKYNCNHSYHHHYYCDRNCEDYIKE